MKRKRLVIGLAALGALLALGAGSWGLYMFGMQRGMGVSAATTAPAQEASGSVAAPSKLPQSIAEGEEATRRHIKAGIKAGDLDPSTGSKVLYYHDPMVPGNKFDKPAKSPFMDMMLVPVYAAGDSDGSKVTVSARIQQNLGLRTAEVTEGRLAPQVVAVGSIAFNERDQAVVQARATGYVEKLYLRATLDPVRQGQPLADVYVPDWISAQEEFLSLRRMSGTELAPLVDGARQRMRQVGMSEAQIELVESSGRTQPRLTLAAPIAGIVTELMAREGMTVMAGATLFRINGLSTVWANAELPREPGRAGAARCKGTGEEPRGSGRCLRRQGAGAAARCEPGHANLEGAARTGEPRQQARARHVRADVVHGPTCRQGAADPDRSRHPDRQAHGRDAGRR